MLQLTGFLFYFCFQHSSDQNAAGCSGSGSGLGVVDENLVGRKLFSPSALLHLLNSTELGKDIIRRSEVGELSTGRQHELAGIVAEWHLANRTRVTQEDLEEYAATVTAVFHSEKKVKTLIPMHSTICAKPNS